MRAWIKDALGHVKTKEQLKSVLHDLCEPYGKVDDIVLDAVEPTRLTCRIRMSERSAAASAANWLGSALEESGLIVLNYQTPAGFQA